MALLEINDLHVSYGSIEALHGVNLVCEEGSVTVIIGSNGAGKTTTINAVSGIVKHTGEILFAGERLPSASNQIVRRGIVQVPEGRRVFAGLTVEENLRIGAYSLKKNNVGKELERQYETFPRLGERRHQDAGTLSGGEQQMLAISRGLMANPRLLMLDEPSLGLAPLIVSDVFSIIKSIRAQGTSILLVEQNANKSLQICDYAYVLENGVVVNQGSGKALMEDSDISSAYLGKRK